MVHVIYLDLNIFAVHIALFLVLGLETNGLILSAPHIFFVLLWVYRLQEMHILIARNRDENCLCLTKPWYVVLVCHFGSKLVPLEICFHP